MYHMKQTHILLGFVMVFFTSFFMASCLNEDNKIPPNCYDGLLNNGEERIDCGGANCPLCDPCENFIWEPELGEQWVDCGGECEPCLASFNGQLDPGEEGIDCGGDTGVDCGQLCGDGLLNGNEEEIDCGGPDCDPCPTCTDGMMNGDEQGIDCGGSDCDPCSTGGDCTNGEIDGDEQYIDCGGTHCPPCVGFLSWKANGQTHVADFSTTASMAGSDIQIGGVSLQSAGFAATIPEPLVVSWIAGSTSTVNTSNFPAGQALYSSPSAVTYSTQFGTAQITFNIEYVNPVSGGFIKGTFSGSLVDASETDQVNISQGQFSLPIN
jgi:hypothetical protein